MSEYVKQAERAFISPTALTSQRLGKRMSPRPWSPALGSQASVGASSMNRRSVSMISSAEDAELFQQIGISTSVIVSPKKKETVRSELQRVSSPMDDFLRGANAAALSLMRSFSPTTTPRATSFDEEATSLWHFTTGGGTAGAETTTSSQRTRLNLHNNDNSFHVLANLLVDFLQTKLTQDGKTIVLFPEDRVRMERVLPEAMRLDFIDAVRYRLEKTPAYPTTPLEYLTLQCQELGLDRDGRLNPVLVAANLEGEPSFIPISSVLKESSFDRSVGSFGNEGINFQHMAANFSNPTTVDDEDEHLKRMDTDDEIGFIPPVPSAASTTEPLTLQNTDNSADFEYRKTDNYTSAASSQPEAPDVMSFKSTELASIREEHVVEPPFQNKAITAKVANMRSSHSASTVQTHPMLNATDIMNLKITGPKKDTTVKSREAVDPEDQQDLRKTSRDKFVPPATPNKAVRSPLANENDYQSDGDRSHDLHINEHAKPYISEHVEAASSGSDSFEKVEREDAIDGKMDSTSFATDLYVARNHRDTETSAIISNSNQQVTPYHPNKSAVTEKKNLSAPRESFGGTEPFPLNDENPDDEDGLKDRDPIDDFDFVTDFSEVKTDSQGTKANHKAVEPKTASVPDIPVRRLLGLSTDASENGVETVQVDKNGDNDSVGEKTVKTVMTYGVGPMSATLTQEYTNCADDVIDDAPISPQAASVNSYREDLSVYSGKKSLDPKGIKAGSGSPMSRDFDKVEITDFQPGNQSSNPMIGGNTSMMSVSTLDMASLRSGYRSTTAYPLNQEQHSMSAMRNGEHPDNRSVTTMERSSMNAHGKFSTYDPSAHSARHMSPGGANNAIDCSSAQSPTYKSQNGADDTKDNVSVSTMERALMVPRFDTRSSGPPSMSGRTEYNGEDKRVGTGAILEPDVPSSGLFNINPFTAIANVANPFTMGTFEAMSTYTNYSTNRNGNDLKAQDSNDFMSEISGFTGMRGRDRYRRTNEDTDDSARQQLLAELREAKNLMGQSQTPETLKFWKNHVLDLQARIHALDVDEPQSVNVGNITSADILENNRRLVTELSHREQYTQAKPEPVIPKIDVPRPDSAQLSTTQPVMESMSLPPVSSSQVRSNLNQPVSGSLSQFPPSLSQDRSTGNHYVPPALSEQQSSVAHTVSDHEGYESQKVDTQTTEDERFTKCDVPMVDVVAPADLPAGYQFEAEIEGKRFLATVPPGGVQHGETFTCYMRELDSVAIDIPVGYWKDNYTNIYEYGCCHSVIWNSFLCPLVALGQIQTRVGLDFLGRPYEVTTGLTNRFMMLFVTISWCIINTMLVFGYQWKWSRGWDLSLADWVACILVNVSMLAFIVFVTQSTRSSIREKFMIREQRCYDLEDICCATLCLPCTVGQMARHTANYDDYEAVCCSKSGLPDGVRVNQKPKELPTPYVV